MWVGHFVWLVAAMEISAPGTCPTAADVQQRLAPLLPPDFQSANADTASVEENSDGTLTLTLARPDGVAIAHRTLPRAQTCVDQAETVSATLAAWEAQIHPEISLRLDRLPPAPTTTAPLTPAPPAKQGGERPLLLRASHEQNRPASVPWALFLGVGLAGAWQPDSVAPGGRVDLMVGRIETSWHGRLSAGIVGSHTSSVPPGQVHWWRSYLALGADYAIPLGRRWTLTAGGAGVLGMVTISGSGYSLNQRARSADVGGEAQLRLGWRAGGVRPWLGVTLLVWLRRQDLEVTGIQTSSALPVLEPLATVGADFQWRP